MALNDAIDDFNEYFQAAHGCEPYAWQTRLARFVLENERLPSVIDMPAGTGKSAVLDIALFALAAKPDVFPRRMAFVVDRRIVVDQVCERAERVAKALKDAGERSAPALKKMRDSLKALSGESKSGNVLEVASLRGGKVIIDDEWTRYPDQPGVIVSTVDMFGSRLLFRGYGTSARMRPIHAALTGNDCLVILDEAQISRAFETTLTEVQAIQARQSARSRLPNRFMVSRMSATIGAERGGDMFALGLPDMLDDRLRPIVDKRARLNLAQVANRDALRKKIAALIRDIRKEGRLSRVGVIVNRVNSAREIAADLRKTFDGLPVSVVTGRMRPLDRVDAAEMMKRDFPPDRDALLPTADDPLRVLVATQSLEVGADISFDGLISECAPSDSLRQRFGRLARRGLNTEPAPAWIAGMRKAGDDPVYGKAVDAAWAELRKAAPGEKVIEQSFFADFGAETRAPFHDAPLIMDAHMDVWSQTWPEPPAQPELDWHLHGIRDDPNAEITVIWRDSVSRAAIDFAPPSMLEGLRIPIAAARQWLAWNRGGDAGEVDVADVRARPDARIRANANPNVADGRVRLVRKAGEREFRKWKDGADTLAPGDAIIVPPTFGGLSEDGVWDKNSKLVMDDLGNAAQLEIGRGATLCLNPSAPSQWWRMKKPADGKDGSPPRPDAEKESGGEEERAEIRKWLADWVAAEMDEDAAAKFRAANKAAARMDNLMRLMLDGEPAIERLRDDDGREFYGLRLPQPERERDMDGSDELGSMTGAGTPLLEHMEEVGRRAGETAERLGFPPDIAADLRLAGRLHDVGKAEPGTQEALAGGDPVRAAMLSAPLAKSLPGAPRKRLPSPHDALGAAMAAGCESLLAQANDPDLVIHLVASHHGFARPLGRAWATAAPQEFGCEFGEHELTTNSATVNSASFNVETVERFWRLTRRYGHYGLAWMETILRLADHRQSESEAESHG